VRWLIENKYLAPYEYYSVTVADLSDMSDCNDAADLLMKSAVYGKAIETWKRLAEGLPTVCYCASVKHSDETAKAFREAGINAVHFDGTTPYAERKVIVDRFRAGEIQILCNCDLISMGFDMPDIGCVLMLRPTQSASLYIQQSGRALRYKPGKTAVIIDAVANFMRFQLPDEPYEWSLDIPIKQRKEINERGDFYIRTCPSCYMVFPTAPACPYCGHTYPLHPREIKAREEIELKRITAEEMARVEAEKKKARMEQGRAQTFEELVALAKKRGYKNPAYYATQVMRGRRR
jgi:superfamily II DNA or RNA helicase